MQPQNSQQNQERTIENESNLLHSTILPDQRPIGAATFSDIPNTFDQQPVGSGGTKFQFSQFPQDGQLPKPAKKIIKTLKPKKPVSKKSQQPEASQNSEPAEQSKQAKQNQKNSNGSTIPLDQRPMNTQKFVAIDQLPINKKGTFDEAPIGGGKSNFMMSQFPEGQQVPAQTTETIYPMGQKLKSKAIKLRLSGMQDLLALLGDDPNSPQLAQIQISKLMKQSNPACLQKILQCYKIWIQKGKNWEDQQIQAAIQNGYVNGKPNTKKLTVQLCDIMYEQKTDLMQRTILTGLKGKVAKSIQGYLTITMELLGIYGIKKMKFLKPYIPEIVRILNTQKNPAVKTEGINLLKETYKWMGKEAVFPFLQNLKENFQKDLQVFWETYDQNAVMTAPKDVQDSIGDNGAKGGKKKLDAYEISDAVDIFKKFNEKWSESVIKAQKWNEKTRLMQQLITAATVPKIAPTDYRHIQQMVKRLINDSNQQVVMYSLRILGALSKGMRKPFAPFVKTIFSNVISKFRDKKTQMIDQTYNTLNDFQYVLSIQDVLDDIKEGLGDKAPNMKVNLIKWIGKFVQKRIDDKGQLTDKAVDGLRALFPIFEKLLQDGTAEVRNCMVENIAKMKLMIGDNFFDKIQNKMNKNQASKVLDVKENIKIKLPTSKEKNNDKDLSKSQVSVSAKDAKPKMSRTMNQSTRTFVQQEEAKRNFTQVGGKIDLSGQIQNLLPKMNDQKYWQKRKQGAQTLISLINEYGDKISLGNSVYDLLSTLRVRINDPNKQLIKVFIQLTGLVFGILGEREVKANAKNFICALAEGLSDRNEQNRKEMVASLNRIGEASGKQFLLATMAQYLQGHTEGRIEVINLLMMNEDHFSKTNTRDYPKGIINCLCDKNKDIRKAAEMLLERVVELTGFNVFKSLAKEQKPAVTKDINSILDKLQKGNNMNNSALMSKGVSPIRTSEQWGAPPTGSARKKSISKINKSFEAKQNAVEVDVIGDLQATLGKNKVTYVQGDDFFAPLKLLTNQRIQRQQQDERIPWRTEDIKQDQEEQLKNQLEALIKEDVVSKMLSFDYRKVLVSILQIVKICKDLNQQASIREIYDLIFKWALIRLWGGNSSLLTIVEVIPPVMSILEKKKIYLNDNDLQTVIGIIREYFIGAFLNDSKVTENLHTITKCLIELSSGDRVLRKVLKQFTVEIGGIHRHIRKEANVYYRQGIARLIKNHMMEYMGNEESLIQTSRIKELKNDRQFVEILYKKFHENVLNEYGFKHPNQMEIQKPVQRPVSRAETMHHPPQPQNNKLQTVSHKNIPSSSKLQSIESSQNQDRDHSASRRVNNSSNFSNSRTVTQKKEEPEEMPADFDLNAFPAPHPSSPLGKNIAKLIPPNEQTINFFNALFMETGQKISNQLITHAKIIFGSILKSVVNMLERRSEFPPEKIVNQINLLQQAIKCRNIIKNVGQLLYYVTNFALTQLVYQDENKSLIYQDLRKRGIDYKIENFIKVINGVMLRILQNASHQETTNILLDLLIKNSRTQCFSQKTVYLIIKCISRISTQFANECRPEHVKDYFIRVNEYIAMINLEFPLEQFVVPTDKPKPQENLLKAIKTTLQQICKLYKNGVWSLYDRAMNQARYPDNHIASFITSQGIPYPEKGRNNQNDQMKKINQLLSKNKTFASGIEKLKFYVSCNPDFNPVQYFTSLNYDHKFIQMVMNALESGAQQADNKSRGNTANFATSYGYRKTPTKAQRQDRSANRHEMPSSEGNIQDKIKKLKMKFEELQPKEEVQPQLSSQRNNNQERNEERAMQIKRRIDQMKNKMTGNYQRQPR